jgi:hypothetical protein
MLSKMTSITKARILAMARVEQVVDSFRKSIHTACNPRLSNIDEQDVFVDLVESCWNEFGPSERYIKRLVSYFVHVIEKDDGSSIESDKLMELVFRTSLSKDTTPDSNEFCYLSFCIPPISGTQINYDQEQQQQQQQQQQQREDTSTPTVSPVPFPPPLRIRVYPYHNDVALRLWEAGSSLAEFFLHNPSILSEKHVIELGAGVGFTSLVIMAFCKPASVHLTDYTEPCLLNLDHNLKNNREWLDHYGISPERVSRVSLLL